MTFANAFFNENIIISIQIKLELDPKVHITTVVGATKDDEERTIEFWVWGLRNI